MINSLKNNKKLLRRKSRFEKNEGLRYSQEKGNKSEKNIFKSQKASPEVLEKIRKEAKLSRRKWILFYFIVSVVVIGAISYVVYDYNQDVINAKIERKKERAERHRAATLERLNKAIKNGNNYFESGKWELAVDQYYKAYRIQPENISLYYRLTESMVFCCRDLNAYCDNASMFIKGFEDTFPDESVKIKKLKNYQAEIKG